MIGSVTLGIGQLAGIGLVSGFYEWIRQAEFSADRAGLLVCQDARVACTAIMKLGGGGTRLDGEMSVDLFLEQARQHTESAPAEGIAKALLIARAMHLGVIVLLGWLAFSFGLPWPAWAGIAVVASLLAYEHSLVKAHDLSKLNAAFFTMNGVISVVFFCFVAGDLLLR